MDGIVLSCRADPTSPTHLALLYSSGTLRRWNVADDSFVDFALFIPSQGLSIADDRPTPCRRSALPICAFDFVAASGPGVVALAIRRHCRVYLCTLPSAEAAAKPAYLSGSRLYEFAAQPPAPPSLIRSWLVSGMPDNTPTSALAVACEGGSMTTWLCSDLLTPPVVTPTSYAGAIASPTFVRVLGGSGGLPANIESGNVKFSSALALTGGHAHSGGSGTLMIEPLWVSPTTVVAAGASSSSGGGLRHIFATGGTDGRVRLWAFRLTPQSRQRFSSAPRQAPEVSLECIHEFTALESSQPQRLTALGSAAWPVMSTIAAAGAAPAPVVRSALRSLLVVGSSSGHLAAWELIIPEALSAPVAVFMPPSTGTPIPTPMSLFVCAAEGARPLEPVTALSLSQPRIDAPIHVAAAAADGSVSLYRMTGTQLVAPPTAGGGGWRARGSGQSALEEGMHASLLRFELQVMVGSDSDASPSALDVLRELGGGECELLRSLGGPGSSRATGRLLADYDHGGVGGGGSNITGSDSLPYPDVARALTAVALQNAHRSIASLVFLEAAAPLATAGEIGATELGRHSHATSVWGALCAVTGGGDVMLWPKEGLPGAPLLRDSEPRGEGGQSVTTAPPLEQQQQQQQRGASQWVPGSTAAAPSPTAPSVNYAGTAVPAPSAPHSPHPAATTAAAAAAVVGANAVMTTGNPSIVPSGVSSATTTATATAAASASAGLLQLEAAIQQRRSSVMQQQSAASSHPSPPLAAAVLPPTLQQQRHEFFRPDATITTSGSGSLDRGGGVTGASTGTAAANVGGSLSGAPSPVGAATQRPRVQSPQPLPPSASPSFTPTYSIDVSGQPSASTSAGVSQARSTGGRSLNPMSGVSAVTLQPSSTAAVTPPPPPPPPPRVSTTRDAATSPLPISSGVHRLAAPVAPTPVTAPSVDTVAPTPVDGYHASHPGTAKTIAHVLAIDRTAASAGDETVAVPLPFKGASAGPPSPSFDVGTVDAQVAVSADLTAFTGLLGAATTTTVVAGTAAAASTTAASGPPPGQAAGGGPLREGQPPPFSFHQKRAQQPLPLQHPRTAATTASAATIDESAAASASLAAAAQQGAATRLAQRGGYRMMMLPGAALTSEQRTSMLKSLTAEMLHNGGVAALQERQQQQQEGGAGTGASSLESELAAALRFIRLAAAAAPPPSHLAPNISNRSGEVPAAPSVSTRAAVPSQPRRLQHPRPHDDLPPPPLVVTTQAGDSTALTTAAAQPAAQSRRPPSIARPRARRSRAHSMCPVCLRQGGAECASCCSVVTLADVSKWHTMLRQDPETRVVCLGSAEQVDQQRESVDFLSRRPPSWGGGAGGRTGNVYSDSRGGSASAAPPLAAVSAAASSAASNKGYDPVAARGIGPSRMRS